MASPALLPDWRDPVAYAWLMSADRGCFAWEWLRRSSHYRGEWRAGASAGHWGLVQCEDPSLDARSALPLWRYDCDPAVLRGAVVGVAASEAGFDFRSLGPVLRVVVSGKVEHIRLGDARCSVRIDLEGGGISGGPVTIAWRLVGIETLAAPLRSLALLRTVCRHGWPARSQYGESRAARWILALRACDAIRAGASHQDMARGLFGALVVSPHWRTEASSIRLRVQRLARTAGVLRDLPSTAWFA